MRAVLKNNFYINQGKFHSELKTRNTSTGIVPFTYFKPNKLNGYNLQQCAE